MWEDGAVAIQNRNAWLLAVFAVVYINSLTVCASGAGLQQRSPEHVRIASFNIQVFGTSKMACLLYTSPSPRD